VIFWRVLPWDPSARPGSPGGALWFPRPFQGTARHDNPARYGCLYATEAPVSAIAEALAPFRGTGDLEPEMLTRMGRPLALARLELRDARLLDLDDPAELVDAGLRPSQVATNHRDVTQPEAARLHDSYPDAAGLRWWSTLEASWINATLFDRAAPRLRVRGVSVLGPADEHVRAAAAFLGLGRT
jgi:RES domain